MKRQPYHIARQVLGVLHKDLLLEWRTLARVNATLFFGLLTLLMFSFAVGPNQTLLQQIAAGFIWLAVFLASVLNLNESMRGERENAALDGMLHMGVKPQAIFLGKALACAGTLFVLSLLLLPIAIAIYGVEPALGWLRVVPILALGCLAVAAPGTLYAAIASQIRARDVLLPLLMFPVLVPGLLAAVKATQLVFEGDPMQQQSGWLTLLSIFALVYWLLGTLLFAKVVDH